MSDAKTGPGPVDRLTRLAEVMTDALEADPECGDDVKGAVFLDSMTERRGGIVLFGWEDYTEAMPFLFQHLKAIFESHGRTMMVTEMPGDPSTN